MLDVHAPEHRVGGVRDFLLHIFTITIGLLIALALEAGVEAMHHRHQRREAEETIRQELKDNRQGLLQTQASVQKEIGNMMRVLAFAEARAQGKPGDPSGLTLSFTEHSLTDTAWQTASATGVLTYMDYAEVQRFSLAYRTQKEVEDVQKEALDNFLQVDSYVVKGFDPSQISAEDVKGATPEIRRGVAHLAAMQDLVKSALNANSDALK